MLGAFVYYNLNVARSIVKGEAEPGFHKEFLSKLMTAEELMKFRYLEHVGLNSDPLDDPCFAFKSRHSTQDINKMASAFKSALSFYKSFKNKKGSSRDKTL